MTLDLPQPLGPTIPVRLVGKCRTVGSTNDLKPASLMVVRRMGQLVGCGWRQLVASECGTVPAGRPPRNVAVISRMGRNTLKGRVTSGLRDCFQPSPSREGWVGDGFAPMTHPGR